MGENQESIRLLHTIRNMLIGKGLMVSALGLLAFGYLFAEGTNLFTAQQGRGEPDQTLLFMGDK